jgi:hypothetical protein
LARSTGGAGEAGDAGADREQRRVRRRRAVQVAAQQHPAGHREQGQEQDDEGDVFQDQRVQQHVEGRREAVHRQRRQEDRERPGGADLAVVVMPQPRRRERQDRDREQEAGERQGEPDRHVGAVGHRGLDAGGQRRRCQRKPRDGDGWRGQEARQAPAGLMLHRIPLPDPRPLAWPGRLCQPV